MEALMSHIMQRVAGVKRAAEDSPLDLTQPKFLRHSCDSLVDEQDLRPGSDSNIRSDFDDVSTNRPCGKSIILVNASPSTSAKRVLSFSSSATLHVKKESESCEHEVAPHPFSIEALLCDTNNNKNNEPSAAAVVYSFHAARTSCTTVKREKTSECHTQTFDVTFWCHACNALCTDKVDAQRHQYLHYMQGIKCNLKKELFQKQGYVSQHVHVEDEKMQCGLCNKMVAQCFFTKHQRLHDGHFCELCRLEFSSNSRLQDHMNIHTGCTPFSCKTCDRKFAKRSSLTQHQRYHRDHQSFNCSYCHKSFSSKYTRVVHERLHTGDNPFKCKVPGCTRAFPQKIQLQLHMNIHS